MGKRKKENLKQQLADSVDPRFSMIFKSGNVGNSNANIVLSNPSATYSSDNSGFETFIANKLSDFLDKNLKVVDRPVIESDIFKKRIDGICLFSDSDVITELCVEKMTFPALPKKKHKKRKSIDKESVKDVVVTADWLKRQAQILNS